MKKSLLAITMMGLLVMSCGQKKEESKDVATETTEQVETAKAELTHSIEWTAFKTPEKVGVKGTFSDVKLLDVKEAATLEESLKGASFIVTTSTVSTNDAGRDEKLKVEFFAKMVGNINGFFGEFKDGKVLVNLTMNGVTKEKEFTYVVADNTVKINGSVDILGDFVAQKAFDSLHEACKDLHAGKTWSDVEIAVEIKK